MKPSIAMQSIFGSRHIFSFHVRLRGHFCILDLIRLTTPFEVPLNIIQPRRRYDVIEDTCRGFKNALL